MLSLLIFALGIVMTLFMLHNQQDIRQHAAGETIISPKTDWTVPYSFRIETDPQKNEVGKITITLNNSSFSLFSTFSYPGLIKGGLNGYPLW